MNSRSPRHTPARAGAAVHRPAPVASTVAVAAPLNFSPNAALLIDFDNVTMGIRSDLQTELRNLLASDIIKGKVQLRRAYADWRRYPQYVAPLAESSIDMIMAPAYGSSKKNATDIRLAIDALELVFTRPEIGTYILLSGDSDFSTLVIKLKEYGKYVIGVGIRESSSDLLVMNCDEYYSYNTLAGLVRAGEEEAGVGVRRDPWELVSEAIARMQRNGDVMRADRLKQVMQDIDSTFDEKNLGMSKFSRFVQEAAQRGLLSLTKMENGQLEVGPAHANGVSEQTPGGVVGAVSSAAGEERPEDRGERPAADRPTERGEERSRRGRRGGRGRGRVREGRGSRESAPAGASADAGSPSTAPTAPTAADEIAESSAAVPQPVAASSPVRHAPTLDATPSDTIGTSGERLTRDEAFDLVRRAVSALEGGPDVTRASDVRARAYELLGRDSESLSERNFSRILRDAHDADVIDLRRRGDDYEVARAVSMAPVAQQLNAAVAARAGTEPASAAAAAASPAMRRGLGVRGARRGGVGARSGTLPPDLLTVGIVDMPGSSPATGVGSVVEAEHPVAQAVEPVTRTPTVHIPSVAPTPTVPASTSAAPSDRLPATPARSPAAKRARSARTKRAAAAPAAAEPKARAKRPRNRAAAKSTEG